jgi:hypothetical protein
MLRDLDGEGKEEEEKEEIVFYDLKITIVWICDVTFFNR